ncbi:MAG: tyrosine-protein kinase family protein [Acidobacteria bacterium]|nr:MAG: tyrosine-protein kinase family protein [Acidobacteriota bacterium]
MAEVLAGHVSGTVCLVDCDPAAPSLHDNYGTTNDAGLADAVDGPGPVRRYAHRLSASEMGSLWLLPFGRAGAETLPSLLGGEPGRRLFDELRRTFDFVVVHGPPIVTASAVALALGALTDGVILVADANWTRRDAARMAADTLREADVTVLGAVLNNRTFPIPEIIYRRL